MLIPLFRPNRSVATILHLKIVNVTIALSGCRPTSVCWSVVIKGRDMPEMSIICSAQMHSAGNCITWTTHVIKYVPVWTISLHKQWCVGSNCFWVINVKWYFDHILISYLIDQYWKMDSYIATCWKKSAKEPICKICVMTFIYMVS